MMDQKCFGVLERVFPLGAEGLREVRADCRSCARVKDCLATAARGPDAQEMLAQRESGTGPLAFLKRWSDLKLRRQSR